MYLIPLNYSSIFPIFFFFFFNKQAGIKFPIIRIATKRNPVLFINFLQFINFTKLKRDLPRNLFEEQLLRFGFHLFNSKLVKFLKFMNFNVSIFLNKHIRRQFPIRTTTILIFYYLLVSDSSSLEFYSIEISSSFLRTCSKDNHLLISST